MMINLQKEDKFYPYQQVKYSGQMLLINDKFLGKKDRQENPLDTETTSKTERL
jgi:hypothetical protein